MSALMPILILAERRVGNTRGGTREGKKPDAGLDGGGQDSVQGGLDAPAGTKASTEKEERDCTKLSLQEYSEMLTATFQGATLVQVPRDSITLSLQRHDAGSACRGSAFSFFNA